MDAIGRFIEALASVVNGFGFSLHLSAKCAFNDVADDGTRMTMRWRRLPGSISDLNDGCLQVSTVQAREGMGKKRFEVARQSCFGVRRQWSVQRPY